MRKENRDLLVLSKNVTSDAIAMQIEINKLGQLLHAVENLHSFCIANEIIDINKYKIITKPYQIQQRIRQRNIKPFVFIINKN